MLKHTKTAQRRERNRLKAYAARMASEYSADGMQKKRAAYQRYLDQIELDKLNGLESSEVRRAYYAKLPRRPRPASQRSRKTRRTADTYRAQRRIAERGPKKSLLLRAERKRTGLTRS